MKITITNDELLEGATTKEGGEWFGGETPYRKDLRAGIAKWAKNEQGEIVSLMFVCPCGCGAVRSVAVRHGYGGYVWQWNNDQFNPTLMPSIRITSGCGWHGYLTSGEFKPA